MSTVSIRSNRELMKEFRECEYLSDRMYDGPLAGPTGLAAQGRMKEITEELRRRTRLRATWLSTYPGSWHCCRETLTSWRPEYDAHVFRWSKECAYFFRKWFYTS